MTIFRALAAAAVFSATLMSVPAQAQVLRFPYEAPTTAPVGQPLTLNIAQGSLKGAVADGVEWFLGIPYAAAPVGNLRWRPPGTPPSWKGVRDAAKAGAVCSDVEDCLFLNVLRPAGAKPGQKLPVMVWIHGGAFVAGTSMGGYGGDTDGREFAKQGIVAVSVNYRLGRAGWFAHPALTKEGHLHSNYGLMDQIAALKWVKANISQFGGDADNVTIFGESAGGASVLNLMVTPLAQGLFNKAIAESSFARSRPLALAEAEANGVALAEAAGIHGQDAAAAAALRKLPLSALPVPQRGTRGIGGGRPYPILDGGVIQRTAMDGFAAGIEAKVPLIIGGNSNEASLSRPTAAMLDAMPEGRRSEIIEAFDPLGTGNRDQTINDFVTVQGVTEPDRAVVRLHTQHGAPSWTYYFAYVPEAYRAIRPYGAAHTEELPFVFISPRSFLTPEDVSLAKAVNAYWASFAKTGSPGAVDGVTWPKWTAEEEGQIVFTAAGTPEVRRHFLKAWRDVAESLHQR